MPDDRVLPFPRELFIGKSHGEPVSHVSEAADRAILWYEKTRGPRLFRVRVEILEELEYVPPGEASLRPKGNPS
jgi:hypothetical protein